MHEKELARLAQALGQVARSSPAAMEAIDALGSLLQRIARDAASRPGSQLDGPLASGTGVSPVAQALDNGPDGRCTDLDKAARPAPATPTRLGPRAVVPLRLGGDQAEVVVRGSARDALLATALAHSNRSASPDRSLPAGVSPAPSLPLIVKRSRLKARACRWSIERRRRIEQAEDFDTRISPTDHELNDLAKALESCYLWTLDPYCSLPDDEALETIAGCYECLGVCAEAMVKIDAQEQDAQAQHKAMELLAAAQSALRISLSEIDRHTADIDQDDAFHWLADQTTARRVYLARHMRLADPADPVQWRDTMQSANELLERVDGESTRAGLVKQHLNTIRYHAERIASGDGREHDWRRVDEAVTKLVAELSVQPSDVDLREILALLPGSAPDGFEAGSALMTALRETTRWREGQEASAADEPAQEERASPDVSRVAELLRGSAMVLIGGDRRAQAAEALERAFELGKLEWIPTSAHQSLSTFEPAVSRPETAVVLLAIRWSSHSFEGVKELCVRHGKPFVRLPGGYSVNQVARQVLEQAGRRLEESQTSLA